MKSAKDKTQKFIQNANTEHAFKSFKYAFVNARLIDAVRGALYLLHVDRQRY